MKRPCWTATTLRIGLVLLLLGTAGAFAETDAQDTEMGEAGKAAGDKKEGPKTSPGARIIGDPEDPDVPPDDWFRPGPDYEGMAYDPEANLAIYGGKHLNKTAEPIVVGRRVYDSGLYATRPTWLGRENPLAAHFMAYGDLRIAAAYNDNGVPGANGKTYQSRLATRLNLDLDFGITATERIHAFVRPLDRKGSFTRYDIDGRVKSDFADELDATIETLFFEGDIGSIRSGIQGRSNQIDLPFAIGRVPVVTQNGVWIEDAFDGLAFSITAKNSPSADISNYDIMFFAGFNKVTTDAVASDSAADVLGMAGFMDLLSGYLEFGYGFVYEDTLDLSYHNVTAAFSRRFGATLSNSVRVIGNFGQDPILGQSKTADGVLLLIENSIITAKPLTFVPYINLFAGWDTPQSLARSGDSGGVLRNTGLAFESDGLTGYPTLDARGHDAYGGAFGIENLFDLKRQLVLEAAIVERMSNNILGTEYAFSLRYQQPISNAWIVRFDAMAGFRDPPLDDILGARLEVRRKF